MTELCRLFASGFGVLLLATAAVAQPTATRDFELESLRSARDALVAAADFSAALDPAERLVKLVEDSGADGLGLEVAHLGVVQAGLGNYEAAELTYLRAIDLIRTEDGEYSNNLIDVHRALGQSYVNSRRFPEAIVALEAAKEISRRNSGLFNVEQSAIIDDLTMAHIGAGETMAAHDLQLERLENAMRQYEADDPRLIPYHRQLGDYYDRSRLRRSAQEQYDAVLALSEQNFGVAAPENLAPLSRLVQIDLLLNEAGDARDKLAAIVNRGHELPSVAHGLSLAILGDWALVHDEAAAAADYYDRAYRVLQDSREVDADEYFSMPRSLTLVPPLSAVDRGARRRAWAWGDLDLKFKVSTSGHVHDVETVSIEPALRTIESSYTRRLRESRFRPRLIAGQAVATADVSYVQSFRYYVDKE